MLSFLARALTLSLPYIVRAEVASAAKDRTSLMPDQQAGKLVYDQHCAACQGARGEGKSMPTDEDPLCGFSTFQWADVSQLTASLITSISREFSDWTREQGPCSGWVAVYQAGFGLMKPESLAA